MRNFINGKKIIHEREVISYIQNINKDDTNEGFEKQIELLRACLRNLNANAFDHEIINLNPYLIKEEKETIIKFFDLF